MDAQLAGPLLGTLVDGRLRIRAVVAQTAMATVHAAVDERLGRTVALKVVHPPQPRRGQAAPFDAERFAEAATGLARLTHPNVAAFYGQGQHDGLPYLVTEFVRGRTLRDVLAERGRLSPAEALAVTEQVLAALAAAHRIGLVHRSVKPENIMVAEAPGGGHDLTEAVIKVTDLGLADAVEAGGAEPSITAAYVAPEFVSDGRVDARGDVYSTGIVLFELLTGRAPYHGERPVEVAWQHVERDVPAPSQLAAGPPVLDDLVASATRRAPAARFMDAGAMLSAVQSARHGLADATTRMRQVAQETMVVSQVQPADRPSWARLHDEPAAPRTRTMTAASATTGLLEQGKQQYARLMGDPRGRMGLLAGAVALVLLVLVGGYYLAFGRYDTTPQLVNLTKQEAEATLRGAGLEFTYAKAQFREDVPKDVVLVQDPAAGADVVSGGTVTLTLSAGPERYTVPDVSGKPWDQAVADLQAEPLKLKPVKSAEKYSDLVPKGSVLETLPKAGAEVEVGAQVKVVLSKGRAPVTVPSVEGKPLAEARKILEELGLRVEVEQVDSDKPFETVVKQEPVLGTGVERGTVVKLQVSKNAQGTVMPELRNWGCGDAENHLAGMGLRVEIRGVRGDKNQYRVERQFPNAGFPLQPGQRVVLRCERR
ncbi:PASTA domain-containing protein [Catellatospora methionotrophica]|uniref:PASTA domain-containing protein n=1 Tax=Catellatospora methionotrophica TaxID=121620 RepID=UPI0033F61555